LFDVIEFLANSRELPDTYRPHKLSGNKSGLWECYVQSDWLLVWEQDDDFLTLLFLQPGTHSDIFK
jgi:mRNA interferase YafQ